MIRILRAGREYEANAFVEVEVTKKIFVNFHGEVLRLASLVS